jgi:GNAT superfamily N-acetyltransferase
VATGATFRDMRLDDVRDGLALCRESGWNQTEADWRMLLDPPSVFRAAVVDGRVVGCAGAMIYGDALAWVCMVLVSKSRRGQGLGTRLVEQVLERLPAVGAVGLDATPKGQSVYSRLGFEPTSSLARLLATSGDATERTTGEARPMTEADLLGVLSRDEATFGADRGRVLRHAFASAPEYAWCVGRGDATRAYGLGRRGALAEHLGPVVAETQEAAAAVVRACLGAHPGQHFFLDAPDWPEWRKTLGGIGFREQRPFLRMYRGGRAPIGQPERAYAAFGPELG